VLIIGILAAIALPQYQISAAKARYTDLMNNVRNVKDAQEIYYMANGSYATNCIDLDLDFQNAVITSSYVTFPNGNFIHCWHGGDGAGDRVAGLSKNSVNSFEIILDKTSTQSTAWRVACWAAAGNTLAAKVCKSMGGQLIINSQFYRLE